MSRETITPQQKLPKLIVVVAFDADEEGDMQPVFGPAEQVSEDRAVRTAKQLAQKHAAVVAWSRNLSLHGRPFRCMSDHLQTSSHRDAGRKLSRPHGRR